MLSEKPERLFESPETLIEAIGSTDARGTYDERRNRILRAATTVFARVGYERASMRAVAKAAGVSLAGMYHYVESKERMLFLIQFRAFNSLLTGLREALHGVDDPAEQLRAMVRSHVGYFAANMAAQKVCSHELDSLTGEDYKEASRARREYYDVARGIVERLLDAQEVNGAFDRHVATMSLFGMLNWLYRWYDPKRGRSPTGVANQIAAQFLHGIGAPAEVDRNNQDSAAR